MNEHAKSLLGSASVDPDKAETVSHVDAMPQAAQDGGLGTQAREAVAWRYPTVGGGWSYFGAELPRAREKGEPVFTHPAAPSADHAELTRLAEAAGEEALGNLLAVIHGDGGHRALEVGTKQAALEAEKIVARLLSSAPEACEGYPSGAWGCVARLSNNAPWEAFAATEDQPDPAGAWSEIIPLYTHPAAPSADKLPTGNLWWNADDWETTFADIEDAYEAATGGYGIGVARLGRATEHDAVWAVWIDCDTTGDGEADDREIRLFATEDEARQALAALKGGA